MPWTQPAGWFLYWLTSQSGSGRCNVIQIWLSGFHIQPRPRSRLLVFPTKPGSAQSLLRWVWAAFPEPGVRGAEWEDREVSPSAELARVQQGSLASGRCQTSWMCARTCSGASSNKLSQSSEQGERLLSWLEPSSAVHESPAITQCPIPWIMELTILASKQKSHKTAALAFLP